MAFVGNAAVVNAARPVRSTSCLTASSRSAMLGSRVLATRARGRGTYTQVRMAISGKPSAAAKSEDKIRERLNAMFDETPCNPIMVRLAWHDAGTYNAENPDVPGADATIRYLPEKGHAANNGLDWAMDKLDPIKQEFPDISYADLYQLASVVAIEHAGGPKIPFKFGRVDGAVDACTPDGRLPDGDKRMGHLRDIFHRMGFEDKEIVVLSGAHTLGRAHKDRSGFEGPWTHEPLVFDNRYYQEILKEDPDPDLLRLASDMALLDEGPLRDQVELYAKDQDSFFKDYVAAHQKLSELGWKL